MPLRSRLPYLLLSFAGVTALGCSDDAREAPARFDEMALRTELESVRRSADIVGVLSEVVTPEGAIRARAGVATLGKEDPVPWDAQFRVASVTKTFVATVVLQLVGEGKLSLEDTVERWLPGVVAGQAYDGNAITVRQLLQHTSGIYDYVRDDDLQKYLAEDFARALYDQTSPEALVAIAMKHPPNFEPGQGWGYSNTNYLLAGMIIKVTTGHDWSNEVLQRIVEPLELKHTFVTSSDPALPMPHARVYMRVNEGAAPIDTTENTLEHTADSAIISTTTDLNRFYRALVTGKLLRDQELAQMQRTVPMPESEGPAGTRAGLGIFWTPTVCGGYWHHAGDSPVAPHTRTGITANGARSIVISMSSTIDESATNAAAFQLAERALCDLPRR
ncbi:beta-lactamase family protein [Pendulispora rubella]|uniref:Beta-lactamase family protein n=1 Tax=Pendulispora rubella TaxID=2741070 RepID=A0ABZ2KRD9_9BACT